MGRDGRGNGKSYMIRRSRVVPCRSIWLPRRRSLWCGERGDAKVDWDDLQKSSSEPNVAGLRPTVDAGGVPVNPTSQVEESHMRTIQLRKAATAMAAISVLLATQYPARAESNSNSTVATCDRRFGNCINNCNHKYGTDRKGDRSACARSCEDKILACEEQPDRTSHPVRLPITTPPASVLETSSGLPSQTPIGGGALPPRVGGASR
jgi:hypothetical protein